MKQYSVSNNLRNLVLVVGAVAFIFSLALAPVHSAEKKKDLNQDQGIPPKKNPPTPPPPTDPEFFSGNVNGNMAVVLMPKFQNVPKGSTPPQTVGKTMDLKANLAQLWNLNRAQQEAEIKNLLKTPIEGHRLYDPKITLAVANANNKLWMAISPKKKQLTLRYTVPGNQIVCRADVAWWFDPTVTMKFDLELVMVLETTGPATDPLVLKSGYLAVRNAKVQVNSDRNAAAERTLNSKTVDIQAKLQPAIALLNTLTLRPYTSQGYSIVTPRHKAPTSPRDHRAELILELSQPPLAVQSIGKKAQ